MRLGALPHLLQHPIQTSRGDHHARRGAGGRIQRRGAQAQPRALDPSKCQGPHFHDDDDDDDDAVDDDDDDDADDDDEEEEEDGVGSQRASGEMEWRSLGVSSVWQEL